MADAGPVSSPDCSEHHIHAWDRLRNAVHLLPALSKMIAYSLAIGLIMK